MVNAIEAFEARHIKDETEIPEFRPGDSVEVNVKITEGAAALSGDRLDQGCAPRPGAPRQAVLSA